MTTTMRASTATDTNRTRERARDKSATRLAILGAARRLAAVHGIDNTTLAGVAAEAGFARATVYGYFKSRDELLQAVVADDLSSLSALVPGAAWQEPETDTETETETETDAPASPETLAEVETVDAELEMALEAIEPADAPANEDVPAGPEPVEAAGDDAAVFVTTDDIEEAAQTSAAMLSADTQDLRVEQKVQLDTILARLAPNDPENSEGSAAAITRFDRRLRVVERSVGDVQSYMERAEKTKVSSSDTVVESLRGINQRLEESERRQRETFAELRASAREASRRLETLEGVKSSAPLAEDFSVSVPDAPEMFDAAPEAVEAAPDVPAAMDAQAEPASDAAEGSTEHSARVTYLTAARQSARIAAEETKVVAPKPWLYRVPKRYLMYVCAAMSAVVLVVGVLVVQRVSSIEARADTMTPEVAQRAVAHTAARRRLAMVGPLDELSALATAGNGKAQLLVGLKYLKGEDGAAKNPVEAARWIARSAQRGEAMGEYWAGYVYQHGLGVSADPDEALRWYEAAADQGNVKAMYNLGVGYAQGWAGAKDSAEASHWFARAARLGFLDAQFNLAVLYERGEGVPPSLVDAYKWYAVAAKSGDAESKKRLDAIATQLGGDDLSAAQRSAMIFEATPAVPEANTLPTVDVKRG